MSTYPDQPEIPFRVPYYVHQASYCVALHDSALCPHCTDSGCPRLDDAAAVLATFREQRAARYRLGRS